jgi:hypothetical protein
MTLDLGKLRATLEAVVESTDPAVTVQQRQRAVEQLMALFGTEFQREAHEVAERRRVEHLEGDEALEELDRLLGGMLNVVAAGHDHDGFPVAVQAARELQDAAYWRGWRERGEQQLAAYRQAEGLE